MAFNLSYIFYAIDQFTQPAQKIAQSVQNIGKDIDHLSEKLKVQSESIKKFGESWSLYLTAPILAFGYYSLKAFNDSAQAMAQINLALKSTGNAAGFTGDQLEKMSEQFERSSLFKSTDILKNVTLPLLRFKDVSGDIFKRTQQDVIDYAARTGKPLEESSMMIEKAIGDPLHGLIRLSRIGVTLNAEQQKVIATLLKQGDIVDVQKYLIVL